MRLRYYDKHGTEIQAGMLLRHDDGATERVLEGVNSNRGCMSVPCSPSYLSCMP